MKPILKTLMWLTIFSIAMGYLETSVVVYLRKLYYPNGFHFPLIPISAEIATTEFWREVATIIMLVGIGVMAGENNTQRFAFFLYCFAVWDIFYYVFLKVLLNWPESVFAWDILFLIPVPWVGPVIAPCIVSFTMVGLAFIIIYYQERNKYLHINFLEWVLFILGSITIMVSFMWDYLTYIFDYGAEKGVWTLSCNRNMFDEVKNYLPRYFNWPLFGIGEGIILLIIFFIYKRMLNTTGK